MQSEMGGDGGSCAAGEPFALQVLGDDMAPEFEHGVIIVVDPEGVVENGCYVVAVVNEEYTFRQLVWDESKRYFLKPLNEACETVEIPNLQGVKGVVVQKAGRRRRERKHYA